MNNRLPHAPASRPLPGRRDRDDDIIPGAVTAVEASSRVGVFSIGFGAGAEKESPK